MITLTRNNKGIWLLKTPTYTGMSKSLDALLEDGRVHIERILIKDVDNV